MEPQTGLAGYGVSFRRTAGFILAMQRSKVDIGMFYDGRCATGKHGGLFNPMTFQPLKSAGKNESVKIFGYLPAAGGPSASGLLSAQVFYTPLSRGM